MKLFIRTVNAAGHLFACVGFAQPLVARGHEVIFLIDEIYADEVKKFGFEVIGLEPMITAVAVTQVENDKPMEHPFKAFAKIVIESGLLMDKTSLEKLACFMPNDQKNFFEQVMNDCIHADPQISKSNPLSMYRSDKLPPELSGLPIEGAVKEKEAFRKKLKATFEAMMNEKITRMWEACTGGPPPCSDVNEMKSSPHLNIYGYPEELDYKNIVKRPANLIGVDAFCRETPGKFELPEEFKAKIKQGDKLIYISMGSMGAANTDMVNRLLGLVADSRHKFIVSMGPLHEDIKLPDNTWGEGFLPQTLVLPLVDLVITHGGNNSFTETFLSGKPMIVMPLFADQWDNAQRAHETGYGIRLNPFACTKEELNEAIEKLVSDQELSQRLKVAAKRIANSNSKEKAVIEIEKLVAKHSS